MLGDMVPKRGVARGQEGVFAGVPAKEVRGFGVKTMMFAGGPDFVQQESAGDVERPVQVVGEAAFFAACGADESAEFGFEENFLARLSAQDDDQSYGVCGEFGGAFSF